VRSPHAPAQLVQLREPEVVGAVHEHRIRVRHVEPRFDDHRGHQHIDIAIHEPMHDVLELLLPHLAVRDAEPCARNNARDVVGHCLNRLDAVVDEEHLPAAIQLARDAFVDQPVVQRLHVREHRRPVARRRLHQRHVAEAGER
jgi:hypothetical protein